MEATKLWAVGTICRADTPLKTFVKKADLEHSRPYYFSFRLIYGNGA